MANQIVEGDMYHELDGQLLEIKRQLRQKNGYPYNPEALKKHLQSAIEGKFGNGPSVGRFLGTVRRGVCKTSDALRQMLAENNVVFGTYISQILYKFVPSFTEEEVDLYEVTGENLGFTKAVTREDIYARAINFGFGKCFPEDGLLYALVCKDGIWRLIGMDPLEDSNGRFRVFSVGSDGGVTRLDAGCDDPGYLWGPDGRWVFVWLRRK